MPSQPQSSLFAYAREQSRPRPLAEQLRPKTLSDFVGQESLFGAGAPLRNLLDGRALTSMILWGPPGVGKTTLARLIALNSEIGEGEQRRKTRFVELSAVHSGLKELREAIEAAKEAGQLYGEQTVLFIDEIHRYSKTQQDALLPYVENGSITLIGATTENPSFQVISALLSRVLVVRLSALQPEQVRQILQRAEAVLSVQLDSAAQDYLIRYANGDARSALTLLDIARSCAPSGGAITAELLGQLAQQRAVQYDRDGDAHYDHASAFQKSLRGSDPNAALYWLGKMISAGEDPRFIARRLIICASEDVGNADPMALVLAVNAMNAVEKIGLPEGRIPLAQATLYVAQAQKSNQAVLAIDAVLNDIERNGHSYPVPAHLRDSHYKGAKAYGHGVGYVYTHDQPDVPQQFLPDELKEKRYI